MCVCRYQSIHWIPKSLSESPFSAMSIGKNATSVSLPPPGGNNSLDALLASAQIGFDDPHTESMIAMGEYELFARKDVVCIPPRPHIVQFNFRREVALPSSGRRGVWMEGSALGLAISMHLLYSPTGVMATHHPASEEDRRGAMLCAMLLMYRVSLP
ncbi:hypothetical protein K505DRAFT_95171 [Melanomma pulvis-pyrius CBS 109.77]|uniref:Uncharacterized protein n=1 Tax=Melanomma pulvis-pyrius CBS 109.77 TaxID=1314802 RepID=A0A6A6WZ76_9PLEO|nr:hypothetical protein K505DRAFT_95171 [Melanomma pulvis-pyrius CBS 109.77]